MPYSGEGNLIEGEIEGDPNKTVRPIVCDEDGHLVIDLETSTITIGTVDIRDTDGNVLNSTSGSLDVNVTNFPTTASSAIITAVTVTTSSTPLLSSNANRKGFTVQSKTDPFYIALDSSATPSLYSAYVLKLNEYERSNYTGPVSATVDSGSTTVLVTELI